MTRCGYLHCKNRSHGQHLVLVGAYGREATAQQWADGKDFKIVEGPYCSARDLGYMHQQNITVLHIVDRKGKEVLEVTT